MGAAIARSAWPARVGRDGTLHVNTADSVWAFELAHRGPEIARRVGVEAVRFAPGPLPAAEASREPIEGPTPTSEQRLEAAAIAASIDNPELRESIEKAVSLSLARGPSDRPV